MSNDNGGSAVALRDGSVEVSPFGGNSAAFETAQRVAKALSQSSIVPKEYQGNLPNVLVAMEYANRLGASVLAVCQNLDVIHGRPSLRATFLIATVNASGRFTPLRFRFEGEEGADDWGCRAFAKDRDSGEECLGSLITIGLAKAEGWYGKSGSKWKTIPEQMLMYRAAAFWTRVYAPEISMGLHTTDEIEDMGRRPALSAGAQELNEALQEVHVVQAEDPAPSAGATERQMDGLGDLITKAREAGAADIELESLVAEALESGTEAAVKDATKKVSAALAKHAGSKKEG